MWYPPAFHQNTCFSIESGLLVFLELQKSLLVSFQGCWTQLQRFESSSSKILHHFQGCWTQWQRFESSSMHCLWDTPLHFLNTCFSLERGLLLFLELQKSLLLNSQGWLTQLQRFESSSMHCLWDNPTAFSQNIFLFKKWFSFIPRAPEIPTSKFSGVLNTMAKVWKL